MDLKLLSMVANGGWLAVASVLAYSILRLEKTLKIITKDQASLREQVVVMEKEKITRSEFYKGIAEWRKEVQSLERTLSEFRSDFAYFKGQIDNLKKG